MADNDPAPDLIPAWYDLLTEARRQRDETAAQARGEIAALRDQLRAAREERDKLQRFKDWVHAYLDGHGVPHHPPGTHGASGCRIGDRMDWLTDRLVAAEGLLRRLLASAELHCHGTGEAEDAARAYLEGETDAP